MSARFDSMGLSLSDSGSTRVADRLIVDQEVVGSNPAPSILCHSTIQDSSYPFFSSKSGGRLCLAGQGFLSTSVDSIDNNISSLKKEVQ